MARKSLTRFLAVLTAGVMMAVNIYSISIPVRADSSDGTGTEQSAQDASENENSDEEAASDASADADAVESENQAADEPEDRTGDSDAEGNRDDLSGANSSADEKTSADSSAQTQDQTTPADPAAVIGESDNSAAEADAEADIAETVSENDKESGNDITVTYAAGEGGSVDRDSESFVADGDVQLKGATATADEGYTFVDWTEDGKEVSKEASFVPDIFSVTGDVTYTANFEKQKMVTPMRMAAANGFMYELPLSVDLSSNVSVIKSTSTEAANLGGTITVIIPESKLLGNLKDAYDTQYGKLGFFEQWLLDRWKNAAFADRTKSRIPVTITLPDDFKLSEVQTSSKGASLITISDSKGDSYTPAYQLDGNKLTVYLNFTGSPQDPSIRYFKEVLENSSEKGTLKVTAKYSGQLGNNDDPDVTVSGGSDFQFGTHLEVEVNFPEVKKSIPHASAIDVVDKTATVLTNGNTASDLEKDENGKREVYLVEKDNPFKVTTKLDLSGIKDDIAKDMGVGADQIQAIKFSGKPITYKISVPEGLTFPEEKSSYTLSDNTFSEECRCRTQSFWIYSHSETCNK
jgi:uncharacterized repeat protein (TIGR02543 family)